MSLMKRLESKLRPWAIPNVTVFLIAGQLLLYIVPRMTGKQGALFNLEKTSLIPELVLQGEVWRLVTFIFTPPGTNSLLVIFFWLILYLCGSSLERVWGTVRYNLYLLVGIFAMIAVHFLIWGLWGAGASTEAKILILQLTRGIFDPMTFLYGSLFLAFARIFPDYTFNLFFILPIRVKWLALIQWLACGYLLLRCDNMGRLMVLASIFNYLLFFGRDHWRDIKHGQRRRAFQARTKDAAKSLVHECRVCGLDSEKSPRTLFRYCSKCAGQCCYCPDHIHDHEHVLGEDSAEEESELANTGQE